MAFPRKFKKLLETQIGDVEIPDYLWLTYTVCGCTKDSCGWTGWMIEEACKKERKQDPNGKEDKLLPAKSDQICPVCGKVLFRTEVSVRYEVSSNQKSIHGTPGIDYEAIPMEYCD